MDSQIETREIDASDYEQVFARYGGSFLTHPTVLRLLERLQTRQKITYHGLFQGGNVVGAVPTAGRHVLAARAALEALGVFQAFDVGQSELVLPLDPGIRVDLPFSGHFMSELNASSIGNLQRDPTFDFAIAKGIAAGPHRLSTKNIRNREYETRRLQAAGAEFVPVKSLSVREFIAEYTRLFVKRRGRGPKGAAHFDVTFLELWDLLCGDMLTLNREPIAMEILYKNVNPRSIYVNYVNSAVDMDHARLSPGSVLLFRNVSCCEEEALRLGKELRFCMGTSLAPYKLPWCFFSPAYVLPG